MKRPARKAAPSQARAPGPAVPPNRAPTRKPTRSKKPTRSPKGLPPGARRPNDRDARKTPASPDRPAPAARTPRPEGPGAAARKPASKPRTGIQSLARAFAIVEEVARHRDGIGLADLARAVGLHNSTAFHLSKTMVEHGYLRKSVDGRNYRVGPTLFGLAAAALDDIELINVAQPVLEQLSRDTGQTSHLAVLAGNEATIVSRVDAGGATPMARRVGHGRPLYCTALGKAVLAWHEPARLARYLAATELRAYTPTTITDPARIAAQLEEIRRTGVAFDDAEFSEDVRCVSAPIRDFGDRVIASVGVTVPAGRTPRTVLKDCAQPVRRAAERISALIGRRR